VSCHQPDHGWAGPQQFSTNFAGKPTPRRAPTLVNRLFSDQQLLGAIPSYQAQHRKVFRRDLDADGVAKAIAVYVRTIVSGNSPYDRFKAGETAAMSAAAQRGLTIFDGKAACVRCHAGFNFTDENYRNIGVGMDKETPDLGRHLVTKQERDKGAFKAPTLRDVAKRGPYMHDGSEKTLADVVADYNKGGTKNPDLSGDIRPLGLTVPEQADLVEFMSALTGESDPGVGRPPVLPN
jgi:cytochrome c peroxidase